MPTTISQEFPFSQIPNWVILHTALTVHDKVVYAVIATHADRQRAAFPGIRFIAGEAGCSTATVQKAIASLVSVGALVVTRTKHEVNHYRLPMNPAAYRDVIQGVAAGDTPRVAAGDTELYPSSNNNHEQEKDIAKRDEWWDTLTELLGKPTPNQESLQGRLVARIKTDGHPPDEILVRAERLAQMWGPEKLTLASLEKHWDRMGVPLAGITKKQIAENVRARELAEAMEHLE